MRVELLVVPDCPHDADARIQLRAALDDVGLRHVEIATTAVESQELAEERHFSGSPTILINGRDPFGEPGREPGLSCRLYESPDGGRSGVPNLRSLRQALKREADHVRERRP